MAVQNRDWNEVYQFHLQLPRDTDEQIAVANNYMAKAHIMCNGHNTHWIAVRRAVPPRCCPRRHRRIQWCDT